MRVMHSHVSRIVLLAGSASCFRAREAPWHSVMDYGAAADGTSKDTAAIEGAINAAAKAGGGTIYLPAGRPVPDRAHPPQEQRSAEGDLRLQN